MDAVEIFALQQKLVTTHIPGHIAGLGFDLFELWYGDQSPLGFLEVPLVLKRQNFSLAVLKFDRKL